VVLVVLALLARLVSFWSAPGAWYFPDSYCYVARIHGAGCGFHPPAVSWLWRLGTFGSMTESHVVLLQSALGVISVLLFYDTLRRLCDFRIAVVVSTLWALWPAQIVFERTILTESICAFLAVCTLWALCCLHGSENEWLRATFATLGAGSLSLALVCKPSLELAGVVGFLVVAYATIRRAGTHLERRAKFALRAALVTLVVGVFATPIGLMASRNSHDFQSFSLDPASGAYSFARWSPLVSCAQHSWFTADVHLAVAQACHSKFVEPPGRNAETLWHHNAGLHDSLSAGANFARTQHQLLSLAESAVLSHPVVVSEQVGSSVLNQLFYAPFDDTDKFDNGTWLASFAPRVATVRSWFAGTKIPPRTNTSHLRSLVTATLRWPQVLIWLSALCLVFSALLAMWLQRSWKELFSRRSPRTARRLVGAFCALFISSSVMTVALTSFPDFRYDVNLAPVLLVALALSVDTLRNVVTS
jgi:4-amino-4-deoxy-L-arabinose transferase-like glycosyltransferase